MKFASAALLRCCLAIGVLALAGPVLGPVIVGPAVAGSSRPLCASVDYNAMILEIIKGMPKGGGYTLSTSELQLPDIAVNDAGNGQWEMTVKDGMPSHCTSATYTVFAHLIAVLHNSGRIPLSQLDLQSVAINRTLPDGRSRMEGEGLFGIFNSNGAGAAALVKHTGTGVSFRDDHFAYARPGDFLKLFWNENVGASESGHQVVYLGHKTEKGRDFVCFWASQRQKTKKRAGGTEPLYFPMVEGEKVVNGYGQVCRPREDIKAMVFTRITCMERFSDGLASMAQRASDRGGIPDLFVDDYLHSLQSKSSDHATLNRMYDIWQAPTAFADIMGTHN
jgi:hypothetical protein